MTRPDSWARRAERAGLRSRAAYKLEQLDEEYDLFAPGDTVVDLGAAPGGWLQVAAEAVGATGRVIGVDRRRIDPLDDVGATVALLRGDITADSTIDQLTTEIDGSADVVLSDMAPNMSGDYNLDHARSIHLARQATTIATSTLTPGGDFVVKVFDGRDLAAFREELDGSFQYVASARPPASRDASAEVYLVAKGHLTAPVEVGEHLTVTITDTGDEGDGIATVDGFTLIVEGASAGETVDIEVTDIKPRYGFATVLR